METPEEKKVFFDKNQTTVRYTDDQKDYINEHAHLIIGDDLEMSKNQFFVKCVTQAIAKATPKTVEVVKDNPEQAQQIETLKAANQELTLQVEELNNKLNAANGNQLPKGAIVLNLDPKDRMYFWGINELCKKQGYSNNYEELLMKMFEVQQTLNYFVIDKKDAEYLNTLDYDGPGENTTTTGGEQTA